MLKGKNTLFRYFNYYITDGNHSTVHIKQFSRLCKGQIYNSTARSAVIAELVQITQVLIDKKFYSIRISSFDMSDNSPKEPMNNMPHSSHICQGGKFAISSEETPNKIGESTNSDIKFKKFQPQVIPENFRAWESIAYPINTHDGTEIGNSFQFKVASYNVLAQYLLECYPYLYTKCSSRNLKWNVRANRLYDEITNLSPDILCLQEVQASHLNSFYLKFEQIGYSGVYKQKTGQRGDGCAIYFKRSMFELLDHITVEFYQPELPILNRDNIGVIVKLLPWRSPRSPIIVATTHLLYNPKRTDVRLAQMQLLLAELDRFSYYNNGVVSGYLPIILTGDFNSLPESAVIELLDKGNVSAKRFRDSSDWKRIEITDNCQHLSVYLDRKQGRSTNFRNVKIYNSEYSVSTPHLANRQMEPFPSEELDNLFNSGELGHSLNLVSVYDKYKPNGKEEATTYQDYWVTVDYIYFSCCHTLRLVERLRLPTVSECSILGSLPNDVYASDHLVLAAVFELKSYKSSL